MPLHKWHFLFMKKHTLLALFCLLLLSETVRSQDLIVKNNNDSINCKVIKQNSETVFFFTYVNKEEVTNAIKTADIKTLKLNYYGSAAKDSVQKNTNKTTSMSRTNANARPRRQIDIIKGFRFSANYGAGYWIFMNPPGINSFMTDYFNELKTGNTYSLGFNYYGSSNFGVGFQYMNFSTNYSTDNVIITFPNGSTQTGSLSDKIQMSYAGISFGYRMPLTNKKWRMAADIGIGYSGYLNNTVFITPSTIKASNVGLNTQIGFDYSLSKNLALGITGTLVRSSTNSYEITNGTNVQTVTLPDDERESHNRADISIGLRFLIE